MPRKPRFYIPAVPAHIVQRGNCRQATFFANEDYAAYLSWLDEGANLHGCAIHAYVLMTNHVHLLITPQGADSINRLIQFVGRHYVTYVNHTYGKSGTLWPLQRIHAPAAFVHPAHQVGRHKGCVICDDDYLLTCMRYIELNPVRAGMVNHPDGYRWSSYRSNASGVVAGRLSPHPLYLSLGRDPEERGFAYRELFRSALEPDQVHTIRATVQTGMPLGNDHFKQQIEQALQCKVGQARRGRPGKASGKGCWPL